MRTERQQAPKSRLPQNAASLGELRQDFRDTIKLLEESCGALNLAISKAHSINATCPNEDQSKSGFCARNFVGCAQTCRDPYTSRDFFRDPRKPLRAQALCATAGRGFI